MAEVITVARPYAQAVFDLAKQGNALGAWSSALGELSALINSAQMRKLVGNPNITQSVLAEVLADSIKNNRPKELAAFLKVLVESRRLETLPFVAVLFEELKAEAEKMAYAEMASAFEVSAEQQAAVKAALKKRLGKEIELHCSVEPGLLGGARIKVGDWVIDGTVQGQLAQLTTQLTN